MKSPIDVNKVYDLYFNQQLSLKNVGDRFGVGPDAIRGILAKNGWKPRLAYELEKKISNPAHVVKLYNSGINGPELAKKFKTNVSNIYKTLKQAGIIIKQGERNRQHTVNQNFFSKWSPLMAYWLGFLCADGHLNQHNNQVSLSQNDENHLKLFIKDLNSDYKIIKKARGLNCYTPGSLQLSVSICSKKLKKNLINLGFSHFKQGESSLIEKIPNRYFSHWLRGMTDGDGTVSIINPSNSNPYPAWRLVGPYRDQLKCIAQRITQNLPITPLNVYKSKTIYVITCKKLKCFKLLKYLYKNNIRSLKRKKEKFETIISQFYC